MRRSYVISYMKAVIAVLLAFLMTVLVGLNKQKADTIRSLHAQLSSAMLLVEPSAEGVPESDGMGDPYIAASEIVSLRELPLKDSDKDSRYFVADVSGDDGAPKRVAFKMKASLVTSLFKDFMEKSAGW
jgi:hypothetical protein